MTKNKEPQERKITKINVHDRALMVKLGMHPPEYEGRNPLLWEKTDRERELLRRERAKHKGRIHMGVKPDVYDPVKAKLIISLKKNNKFPYTTYSTTCSIHAIPNILSLYGVFDEKKQIFISYVAGYKYDGITYKPGEFPIWNP